MKTQEFSSMKQILWLSLVWLSFGACLPADVCDPGQVQTIGNLCAPVPDSGRPLEGGQDGGIDGG